MRHFFCLILTALLSVLGCRTPRKFPPRPTMPIMKIARVSSSIVYSYTMEVEANELSPQVQTIAVMTDEEDGCAMDRHGFCAVPITSERVRFTVVGFAADGSEVDICSAGALTVDLVHRYDADKTVGARVLAREAQAERQDDQCVFTLVERYATLL